LSAQYFIAKVVQANEYVVLVGNKVVAGPFPTAAEAGVPKGRFPTGGFPACADLH
jgi:hypothetical protein